MIQNAVSAYAAARPAVAPSATPGAGLGQALSGAADTHQLVQSIAEAQLALETAVAIRDKVVEAYQDILRMPV